MIPRKIPLECLPSFISLQCQVQISHCYDADHTKCTVLACLVMLLSLNLDGQTQKLQIHAPGLS